ncbi:hypothetical protein [Streptomonospora litoralis]|uniref:hypothetical protein n=1 Tax=Streptomonospora litoralis TaxID=2498135 RepID=UPI001035F4AC|nr:hypothetical protein [Streptomonospora litoralis]
MTCGLLCMLIGPASCYRSLEISVAVSTNGVGDASAAQSSLITGVAASAGVPIVMAVIAAFRRDLKAAGWSAALLAWPFVVTAGVLFFGWTSGG